MQDGERIARQYHSMAVEYSTDNDENAFNAYYERPAMIGLISEVAECQVLEVGCGAGPLTAWLVAREDPTHRLSCAATRVREPSIGRGCDTQPATDCVGCQRI